MRRNSSRRSGGRKSESAIEIETGTENEIESETGRVKKRDLVPKILLKKRAKMGLSHGPQQPLRSIEG